MKNTLLLFCVLLTYQLAISQSGTLDASFGNNGIIKTYPTGGSSSSVYAREGMLQTDGKLVLALQTPTKTRLTRILTNGATDLSYGVDGYSVAVSINVYAAAMQANGKVVVAGIMNGNSDFILARFNTNGTLDASFGNGGTTTADIGSDNDYLSSLVITPAGKIIAGGYASAGNTRQFALVQFNTSGTIDNGFGQNGIAKTSFPNADFPYLNSMTLQPDGKIIAVGGTGGDMAVARYNVNGSPDLTFNQTGQVTRDFGSTEFAQAVVVGNDGSIYVGGSTIDINDGRQHMIVVRHFNNGLPDPNFNAGLGYVKSTFGDGYENLHALVKQNDGKIVAAGFYITPEGRSDITVARINPNGSVDLSFGGNGHGYMMIGADSTDENCEYLLLQPDGRIITGGYTGQRENNNYQTRYSGYRLTRNGILEGFIAKDYRYPYFIYSAVFHQPDGKLLAMDEETNDSTFSSVLRRFNQNGSPDMSFGNNGKLDLQNFGLSKFQPDGKLLRIVPTGIGESTLVRIKPDGSPDSSFGILGTAPAQLEANAGISAIGFQPDGKILVCGSIRDINSSDFLIGRYHSNGDLDTAFGDNGFTHVNFRVEDFGFAITTGPDGKIIYGGNSITFPPEFPDFRQYAFIGRLNADGSVDIGFGDQGKKVLERGPLESFVDVAVQNDNRILYTAYTNNSAGLGYMGRLNIDGSTDNSFGQDGTVASEGTLIIQQPDSKILVAGNRRNIRNNTEAVLKRYAADGQPDVSFGNNGVLAGPVAELDNYFFGSHVTGNILFLSGQGVDALGKQVGLIAKVILDPPPAAAAIATVSAPKIDGAREAVNITVNVYPNPSPNHFNVTVNSNSGENIRGRVLTVTGTVVTAINFKSHKTFSVGETLRPGIFFIEIQQAGVTKIVQIIKQ